MAVVLTLRPGDKAEGGENLRLDLQCDVEILHDVVDSKRHASTGPQEHHGRLKTSCGVAPVIDYDLGDELGRILINANLSGNKVVQC